MSKSLADLRAEKATQSLPTRVMPICLNQELIADVQRLEAEKRDLLIDAARKPADDDQDAPPQRLAGPAATPPRVSEIDTELEALYDRMREYEGELLLRAIPGGEWQRWKDAHPARENNPTDADIGFGLCNAVDLLDTLDKFAAEWNGEPFGPGEWTDWFVQKVAPADLRDICANVVSLHEQRVSVPKSQSSSSGTPTGATG